MISDVKSPRPPIFERGEMSLGRHFLQLPTFAKGDGGGFSCVGATNIQVMNVYECINFSFYRIGVQDKTWPVTVSQPTSSVAMLPRHGFQQKSTSRKFILNYLIFLKRYLKYSMAFIDFSSPGTRIANHLDYLSSEQEDLRWITGREP